MNPRETTTSLVSRVISNRLSGETGKIRRKSKRSSNSKLISNSSSSSQDWVISGIRSILSRNRISRL